MSVETLLWLKRLPFWLLLVLRDLPESGDAYISQMCLPVIAGFMSLVSPLLALAVIPELRNWWPVVLVANLLFYCLSGVFAYFSCEGKNSGPWQCRGGW